MGRHKRFVDNFWVEDINSTTGFDALSQRMRDGRKLCKEIEEYLRQRSKIEATYAKELQKLNKQDNKDDLCGLDNSWKEMKLQTENMAHAHELASKQFLKLSNDISSFNLEQKKQTKDMEDRVSKMHSAAKNTYNKVTNQQKVYTTKYDENTTASNTVKYNERQMTTITPKEMDKARAKADKCKEELEKADNLYLSLVQQVQNEMSDWENEMSTLCNTFQDLEEKRIDHLRDYLWQCSNVDSQANVDHDQCCERVRLSLERCDIDTDIDHFIDRNKVGNKRPARVEYKGHSKDVKRSAVPVQVKDRGRLPSLPKNAKGGGGHIYADVD